MKKFLTHSISFFVGAIAVCLLMSTLTCCMDFDPAIEYRCDPELQPYLDKFYQEAEARGVKINRENLLLRIEPQKNMTGAGHSRRCGCQRVVLISDDSFDFFSEKWMSKDSAAYGLENVIFHELGHALLDRRHPDYESLMQTGISYFVYAKDKDRRKLMLDELFDQTKFGKRFNQIPL
jgi:hypothetical protein